MANIITSCRISLTALRTLYCFTSHFFAFFRQNIRFLFTNRFAGCIIFAGNFFIFSERGDACDDKKSDERTAKGTKSQKKRA